jgi:hypothetical protein
MVLVEASAFNAGRYRIYDRKIIDGMGGGICFQYGKILGM